MVLYDRSVDADWRQNVREHIETHRKGTLTIVVEDEQGNPSQDTTVRVSQRSRAVDFGSAIDAETLIQATDDGEQYRTFVSDLDRVTFENDLKWRVWERRQSDSTMMDTLESALSELSEGDIAIRGHYVTWAVMDGGSVPETVFDQYEGDPEGLVSAWKENVAERVPVADDLVNPIEWDVVNHPVGWSDDVSVVGEEYGLKFYEDAFTWVESYCPDAGHWINEDNILNNGHNSNRYAEVIKDLQERGVEIDGVGFMGHFEEPGYRHPAELLAELDRFADLVPRLQITELDVLADDVTDAAEYFEDVIRVAYSHPAMEAIVLWGFWAGRHWRPSTALYDDEWNVTPIGEAWNQLRHEWWTDKTASTDLNGTIEVRGDTGTYAVIVETDDGTVERTVELAPDGTNVTISLSSDDGTQTVTG